MPVLAQGGGYRASGWLALLTAGGLWTPMHDPADFENGVEVCEKISFILAHSDSHLSAFCVEVC